MNETSDPHQRPILLRLRREWGIYVFGSLVFLATLFLILKQDWGQAYAWRWLALALAISIYQFIYLWRHLGDNRLKSGEGGLFASLGPANWITMIRAIFNAALAGFLLGPWPGGWLAWAPSALYLASALMDFADGVVARLTRRMTVLGEGLDMQWDGTGIFIAASLSVRYGQTPPPYLLVGLARYLFVAGEWLRRRRGLPLNDLMNSRIRRPFAGAQMGFVAVVLMPVYSPPSTHLVAMLFMIPFLVHFLIDWLVVSGQPVRFPARPVSGLSSFQRGVRKAFPLVVRAVLLVLLVDLLVDLVHLPGVALTMVLITGLAIPLLLLGVAGRIVSLTVLLMTGFGLQVAPLDWRYWAILLGSTVLMLVGTGPFSLWKPEDWLLFTQAGEKLQANTPGRR